MIIPESRWKLAKKFWYGKYIVSNIIGQGCSMSIKILAVSWESTVCTNSNEPIRKIRIAQILVLINLKTNLMKTQATDFGEFVWKFRKNQFFHQELHFFAQVKIQTSSQMEKNFGLVWFLTVWIDIWQNIGIRERQITSTERVSKYSGSHRVSTL